MFYKRNDGKLMIRHGEKRPPKKKETREEREKRLEKEFWNSAAGKRKKALMKFKKRYSMMERYNP
jgi:hypothetical protein